MSAQLQELGIVRGVLKSVENDRLTLSISGTSYELHLLLAASRPGRSRSIGPRVAGRIDAAALRMHRASAGGRFIEPIIGHPRIVQGVITGVDAPARKLLVNVSVPMWVTLMESQNPAEFSAGQMVNFYVRSGATFTPVDAPG